MHHFDHILSVVQNILNENIFKKNIFHKIIFAEINSNKNNFKNIFLKIILFYEILNILKYNKSILLCNRGARSSFAIFLF